MKCFLAFLPVFALSWSTSTYANEVSVTSANPLRTGYQLQKATTVVIENSVGNIKVVETDGSVMTIEGDYKGQKPVKVIFGESELGKFKLSVVYPDAGMGGASISVNNGSVNISGITSRGSIVISGGGSVVINGQRISAGQGSTISVGDEALNLKIGIPKTLLANLKLDTTSGDLSVKGPFHSADEESRRVLFKSVSGDIACDTLCTLGALTVESTSGDVILQAVRTSAGTIKTISGDIQLANVSGNLEVKTTSGDVQSEQGSGDIRIGTVSGDVRVRNRTQGLINSQTTSGDIRYSNPDQSAREEAKTLSGDISGMKKCNDALSGKKPAGDDPFKF